MVYPETRERKTLSGGCKIAVMTTILIAVTLVVDFVFHGNEEQEVVIEEVSEVVEIAEPVESEKMPEKVDFQSAVDEWVANTTGNKSVLIYDLDRNEVVGKYNADEIYNTASLYKLFVVYEGYRRVQSGEWQADEAVGYTGHTILECLDLSIRESNSECAEMLREKIGDEELNEIVKNEFGATNTDVSDLVSNASDIGKMMQIFYEHEDIKDEKLLARMKDSFLNQPETEYNWRQGLPSGFKKANVYNKVGWDYNPAGYWDVYHDAAIVEFPEDERHFVVVVMTNLVPYQKIKELGAKIELIYYN